MNKKLFILSFLSFLSTGTKCQSFNDNTKIFTSTQKTIDKNTIKPSSSLTTLSFFSTSNSLNPPPSMISLDNNISKLTTIETTPTTVGVVASGASAKNFDGLLFNETTMSTPTQTTMLNPSSTTDFYTSSTNKSICYEEDGCIDHEITCVGEKEYCNYTREEYIGLLYDYIYPTTGEWILIGSHCVVFLMGLVSY